MNQLDHIHKHQNQKPVMFKVIEPSIVQSQFASKRDASFNSYLPPDHHRNNNDHHQHQQQHNNPQLKPEYSDQISIFDAAKYFSALDDDHNHNHRANSMQHGSAKVLDLSSMARLSSGSSIENNSNYRARSFHATPTASSEASWNSQTGLLANPPGSIGINMIKNLSPNSSTNNNGSTTSTSTIRWPRISKKWLIPRRKCPCSGKKSVQVEERIDAKTPRMVDLRRSTSSNATNSSSLYSTRQNSPKTSGLSIPLPIGPQVPQEHSNRNILGPNLMARRIDHNNNNTNNNDKPNGFSALSSTPKVVGPLKLFADHHANSTITSTAATTTITTTTTSTSDIKVLKAATSTNGFSFPILENQPVAVKKMFNIIAPDHQQDPHRDSLEVYQPRSHPSPRSRRASYEEENVSDGSSDLFEIESFSTTYTRRDSMDEGVTTNFSANNIKIYGMACPTNDLVVKTTPLRRNSLDHDINDDEPMTPSVAPTECYAPSEVSIDWSVTTAEGFDRASLTNFSISASEMGYAAMKREAAERNGGPGDHEMAAVSGGGGGRRKMGGNVNGGGGGLLSCRCEKAVNVGPGPIKCPSEGGPPITARHVGGRAQQQAQAQSGGAAHVGGSVSSKPGLVVGKSRSSLLPMPFAT